MTKFALRYLLVLFFLLLSASIFLTKNANALSCSHTTLVNKSASCVLITSDAAGCLGNPTHNDCAQSILLDDDGCSNATFPVCSFVSHVGTSCKYSCKSNGTKCPVKTTWTCAGSACSNSSSSSSDNFCTYLSSVSCSGTAGKCNYGASSKNDSRCGGTCPIPPPSVTGTPKCSGGTATISTNWTTRAAYDGNYDFRYRRSTTGTWTDDGSPTKPEVLNGLASSATYIVEVRAHTDKGIAGPTAYGSDTVNTADCDAPDLSATLTYPNGNTNTSGNASVTIKNTGNSTASNFAVTINDGAPVAKTWPVVANNFSLGAGASITIAIPVTLSPTAGVYTAKVTVDPTNKVAETDEGNNTATDQYTVSAIANAISCKVYQDLNSDGLQDCTDPLDPYPACAASSPEPPYQGATININSINYATDVSGIATSGILAPGTYPALLTLPANYNLTTPPNPKSITLVPPASVCSFGIQPKPPVCGNITTNKNALDPGGTAQLSLTCAATVPGANLTYNWFTNDPTVADVNPKTTTLLSNTLTQTTLKADPNVFTNVCTYPSALVCQAGSDSCTTAELSNGSPLCVSNKGIHVAPKFSIKGNVYIDADKNNAQCVGGANPDGSACTTEPNYTAVAPTIIIYPGNDCSGAPVSPNPTVVSGAFDSGLILPEGTYSVCYTNLPTALGYNPKWPVGTPPSYTVTVGGSCDVPGNHPNAKDPCTPEGNIDPLNFGISNSAPWFQSVGGDSYQSNYNNPIPLGAVSTNPPIPYGGGGTYGSIYGLGGTPGIIYSSGINTPIFGVGSASVPGWVIGGPSYPETYASNGISTSYGIIDSYVDLYEKRGVVKNLNTVPGCADISSSCNLSQADSGIYYALDTVNFDPAGFTIKNNTNLIILVGQRSGLITEKTDSSTEINPADLNINGKVLVPNGSTLFFTASGNINVAATVGEATSSVYCTVPQNANPSTGCSIEGYYSADYNFIVQGTGASGCPTNDLRLNIGGSVVANASGKGGGFAFNDRDLCNDSSTYPTLSITERPDFILNAPEFFKTQRRVWQEVAP